MRGESLRKVCALLARPLGERFSSEGRGQVLNVKGFKGDEQIRSLNRTL